MIKSILSVVLCLVSFLSNATTWYVRPGVYTTYGASFPNPTAGVYGTQNGTSYANAWNGITSIVWGGAGVNTGDTIYVCGIHEYRKLSGEPSGFSGTTTIGVSGITIRMDYAPDPGTMFGGRLDTTANGFVPFQNGVFSHKVPDSNPQSLDLFYLSGSTITRLPQQTNTSWNGPGTYFLNNTNYVKLPGGVTPTVNNVASEVYGWGFDLNRKSNIVFQACTFRGIAPIRSTGTGIRYAIPDYAGGFIGEKWITFRSCVMLDYQGFSLYPGHDNWTFDSCEMGRCPYGLYSLIDNQVRGPNSITVTNCFIHDVDTAEYPDIDGHAIGVQGGSGHLIVGNQTLRTTKAMESPPAAKTKSGYLTTRLSIHGWVFGLLPPLDL